MRFSLITPTHNTRHLDELYRSIVAQTNGDWEWIILCNNGVEVVFDDPRVKVYTDDTGNTKIGYLKHTAFNLGTGDILVEVDHDDILIPTCLEELDLQFANPEFGFVYSDDAKLQMNGNFVPYGKQYGWLDPTHIPTEHGKLPVMESFDADSGSMSFIWYMPDHVRAWRRDVYKQVGGHDVTLSVLDDQDLMARTYLVTKFAHIKKPLYIYRITGDNSWLQRNAEIQTQTVQMGYKYMRQLAERDAQLNNKMLVDIGGGIDALPGYTTIDLHDADILADLNVCIPLADDSVGVLNASHIIEHLEDKQRTMEEIHRVLCDGGWAFIDVPSTDGRGAWQDPTHVSFWNQNSFYYYTRKEQARYIRNTKIKFQEFRLETLFPSQWWKDNNIPVVRAWLRAVKSDRRRAGLQ